MHLCTCWNQNPSKCTNYFQVFLKNWLYHVHIFSLNMYHGLSLLNNARHFEISRKGDGLSLVHLLGIKAVKIIGKDVE